MDSTRYYRRSSTDSDGLLPRIVAALAEFDTNATEPQRSSLEGCELAHLMGECLPDFSYTSFFPMGKASVQSLDIQNVGLVSSIHKSDLPAYFIPYISSRL